MILKKEDASLDFGSFNQFVGKKEEAARNVLVTELIDRGTFKFFGFICNEVRTSPLVLFKSLAKWYEIPFSEANKISTDETYSNLLQEKEYSGWLKEAVEKYGFDWEDYWEFVERKMNLCYQLRSIPHGTSTAASGVIMDTGYSFLPSHDLVIGFNGEDLESLGYIKYDLLSVNTLNQIKHFEGMDLDWKEESDERVWDVIKGGDTDFVFQFSSPGMKRILKGAKTDSIFALAEANALFRPGPIEMGLIEKYVAIKSNNITKETELSDNEKILSAILKREYGENHSGLVLFQEDVMKLCQIGANFTLTEADDIRKAMGKKKEKVLEPYKNQFIENWNLDLINIKGLGQFLSDENVCLSDGTLINSKELYEIIQSGESVDSLKKEDFELTHADSVKIWEDLKGFAKYAFNKSHSVAYAIIAYYTAKMWANDRKNFIEYTLNNDTTERQQMMMDKCKELGYKFTYPSIFDMDSKFYSVDESSHTIIAPGFAERSYDSYVEFLFGETPDIYNLIYRGVCDKLTQDRFALSELVSTCLKEAKMKAMYMESDKKFNTLPEILDGLKLAEGVIDWYKKDGEYFVTMKRKRAKPNTILFHKDGSNYCKMNIFNYDKKFYGKVRDGVISNIPYINTSGIENSLNGIKTTCQEKGEDAYYKMKKKLETYMNDNWGTDFKKEKIIFRDIYVIITDIRSFNRSCKLLISFNDKDDILYASGLNKKEAEKIGKNKLVKLDLIFSPYIARKTEEFIYDFDILGIEEIKE